MKEIVSTEIIDDIIKEFGLWKRYSDLLSRADVEASACANGIFEFALAIQRKRVNEFIMNKRVTDVE